MKARASTPKARTPSTRSSISAKKPALRPSGTTPKSPRSEQRLFLDDKVINSEGSTVDLAAVSGGGQGGWRRGSVVDDSELEGDGLLGTRSVCTSKL